MVNPSIKKEVLEIITSTDLPPYLCVFITPKNIKCDYCNQIMLPISDTHVECRTRGCRYCGIEIKIKNGVNKGKLNEF